MEEGALRLNHGPEEQNHDDKRMTHNMMEKRRKDRIKQWISHIAQLLPPASSQGPDKPSTLDIMERAANYIIELKASYEKLLTEQGDAVLVEEMHKMRTELDSVRAERDRLSEVLNAAGIAALNDTSQWRGNRKSNSALTENGTSPATAASDSTSEVALANGSDESRSKSKSSVSSSSKRRNTISVHLEQQKLQQEQQQQQQQQQAMAQALASGLLSHNSGFIYSGLPGQNLMVNPNLMVSPSGQVVVSANHQTSLTAGSVSSALDGGQRESAVYGLEKSSQSMVRGSNANMLGGGSIGGLLQIAMQDAGITPSLQLDASRQSSPAPVSELNVHTDSATTESDISRPQAQQQSLSLEDVSHDALQTLASVASNTVSSSMSLFPSLASSAMMGMMQSATGSASLAASTVTVTSSAMNQNTPIMSVGQLGQLQQQQQSQASLVMGMPVLNPLAPNAGLGMVAPNAGQNPGAMGIMPSGTISQHGQLSMIQGAAGPGGLVPGSILMNQQGQLLMINENGLPILMQQSLDPSLGGLGDKTVIGSGGVSVSTNSGLMGGANPTISLFDHQQQALISSGALTIAKSDPGASGNLSSVSASHPHSSILAGMNPQNPGQMSFLGSQLLPQGPLQSLAVQSGGQLGSLLQPGAAINQQLMQSLGLGFPGMLTGASAGGGVTNPTNQAQHAITGGATTGAAATAGGPTAAGGVLFPGGQGSSMMTLNTVPTNTHQLPSALVLPTGHVIPVVSNPQLLTANHGGGGLMSVAPGGSGGLTSGSAGTTGHIQLQQMGGGAGTSQVIQVDPNNPGGAQVFIGPNGLQMTTTAAGQAHLTQQQQIQQLLQQQQNLNLLMPSAAISASQTIPTTTVVTLASTVVPASVAKNVLAKAQMQTTQVLMQRNASQPRTHTTSTAIARKGSQNIKTSSSETQTSSSNTSGMIMQTGCAGTGSTGSVQLTAAGGGGCTTGANSNNGAAAGSAPILLMMQHNGQVVNVLVDPITLQVLNTGQTTVQNTPSVGGAVSTTAGDKSGANSSVHTSVASSGSKKSNKKNSQRTTTPKPKSSKSSSKASSTSTTSTTTSSCSQTVMSRTNAACSVTTSVTQPLVINTDGPWDSQAASNIMICDDTNNPASEEGGLAPSSDNQDILAKAAQSIFTASPTEMTSPIGGAFYNPAHDDNPLLIDTSPAGPDTDIPSSSSPKKSISTNAAPQTELSKSVDCQQQREQHSQMLQEQEALLRQQEQQEQEKLMQQEREQHEQLMRHIEQQQQMGLTSPQTLSLIPPSMPSLVQTSDVGTSLSAAIAVTTADSSAVATNTISSGTDTAGQIVPPPKKPKKSKSKKKDKEKVDGREKDGDGSKSSKKSSKKKKKEQEAAIRRQEEINQQQQQLILQQQQQQQEEQTKLQHHEQEQVLLLQQHQQQQEQQSPGLMSEPQLVQPSAADMIVDEVPDHVVSGAADPFVLPDSITFTESEISDVLDQVEKLGSSLVSDEQLKKYEKVEKAEKREKKSKRRKDGGQMDDGSSNPNKKQCKGNNRDNDSSIEANLFVLNQQLGVRPLSQQQQQDDPNSSSRMSIYDFQDDSPPGLGSAKTESPPKSKSKKSKSKTPSGTQNLLAATSPLSASTVSTTSTSAAATTTLASATTTTSAGTNTPASSLDMLVPALSHAKSDSSSSVSKGSKSSKSKKSDKKDRAKANNASSIDSLNNINAVNSVHSISATARVNTAASENMSIQTNGTISSSKSNDSLSSNSVDSASVILPMPGFDTLEALNSPPPLISPPVSQPKSSGSSGSKGQGQLQDQNLDGSLGQISSIVSSDIVTTMCSTSIETLADISDVVPTSNAMNMDPLMLQSSNSPPPALHHPLTLGHNNSNSMMVQQQQKQKQQQQQSISNKQRQQTPPRHNPAQQMPSHSPQMAQPSQSGPTQGHAHMGPPTSPAQAVGRPRSTSLSHQQQQNQGGYLSSSPQGGGGVRQSPSASCISPSSSHSRGSHENQGFNQGAGAHMAPTQSPSSSVRLNDMSSLLNSPDIPCPNANLFSSTAPKLSHMQKPTSQGKPSCTEDSAASRSRTGIYSADNFVQPSRQTSNLESCSQQSSNSSVAGNMGRIAGMSDASGESFNFTSIGLNLTSSSTQSTGQEMGVASSAGMPFSFSLTSASTTQTSSSSGSHGQVGHHSFPFYPLHPSVTQPSTTSQQSHQTQSLNMMPPGVDVRMDGQGSGHQTSGPGVGGGMPSTAQNSFNFGGLMDLNSSCSGVRDTAMPSDQSHLMSSVDKSPMANFTQHHGGGAGGGSGTNSGQKRLSEIQPPPPPSNRPPQQPTQPLDHGPPINRSPQQMGNHTSPAGNYFSSSYPSSASLNTPPLRHPPLPNSDSNHLMNRGFDHGFGSSQTSASVPLGGPSFDHHGMPYQRDMNQTRPLEHVSAGASTSSRKPSSQPQQQQQNGGGSKQQKQSQGGGGGSSGLNRVPPSHGQSRNMAPNHSSNQSQQSSAPSQAPPPAHQTSGNGQPPAPSPSQQARQAKRKQPSSQSKKSKPTYSTEIDANLSHSIFDNNQSLQSFFSFQNMSPPPVRNLQSEGPSFLPGNLFGSTSRPLSNSSNKNTPDLGPPYALFPPARPQNGLGLNFQHSFGMNTMTGNPGSGHMTPHSVAVPPHMGNFSLSNIFSDSGTNDGGINISPIKFSHPGNPILPPQAGMDPNALQHPHQGSALYHNRSHHGQPHVLPNPMTLNSILGHNHHGFDTRSMSQGINSSVGPPFHGAGHPSSFAIPPLNFSMHDH